jgi:hypothetical protein
MITHAGKTKSWSNNVILLFPIKDAKTWKYNRTYMYNQFDCSFCIQHTRWYNFLQLDYKRIFSKNLRDLIKLENFVELFLQLIKSSDRQFKLINRQMYSQIWSTISFVLSCSTTYGLGHITAQINQYTTDIERQFLLTSIFA